MRIDCYGRKTDKTTFAGGPLAEPLETKTSGKWTFVRFTDGDRAAIHRLGVGADGLVGETWAFGAWKDAETLDYRPLAETLEVSE